ncbi:hypothetical protein CPHO_08390 [Corynebacterium phocae]|uniref:CRISPR-associated protein n=1 Tax=Corynebacterium phocae TaxID=161895 RepID=A0A1L7D4Q7_9CORY|nr:hypothetical protein [Corynebacterium phocae]APT92902.1 hypothetical protein CPHO_08390 [Corynebacterium phocae]KAA8723225.1 hypothetical protein F4V58_07885 [Corynebacterium phocae]
MTTINPQPKFSIPLNVTLLSPLHHGAGSQGNTSVLRTQDVMQPDGTVARVPFLSAASIRHGLRDAFAWHLVKTLDIEEGTLSKTLVDLLWSGGAVTTTGSRTNLDTMRRVRQYLPALSMLGYAAQSDIIEGTLRASDMILVCAENNHRTTQQSDKRAGAYRTEEFGTRHDKASTPAGAYIELAAGEELTTSQMIWDTQCIMVGATMEGQLSLTRAATSEHVSVLLALLAHWAPEGEVLLGAKTAQGYGHARLTTAIDEVSAEDYTQTVLDNKTEIMELLEELAK